MKKRSGIAQLFLRLALGIIFLQVVSDRFGWLGAPGSHGVSWGDWKHFIDYTNTLLPFAGHKVANFFGILATVGEATFGICLIIGAKTRLMALGAALLTFCFGLSMALFVGISAPFNYPVFVFTGAGLLLAEVDRYRWSVDDYFASKKN